MMKIKNRTKINFIDYDKLKDLSTQNKINDSEIDEILNKALKLKGLGLLEVAKLLQIEDNKNINKLLKTADIIKQKIYGKRLVLFAPLYIGNICSNNCLYCAFRKDNHNIKRVILNQNQVKQETIALLKEGHKRLLMLCGESKRNSLDYFLESIKTAYSAEHNGSTIRRINVEIAPLTVEEFSRLKKAKIGTYACFQETYDPVLYKEYHPGGPKADFEYRLNVMDRAMKGGIDDVGIGVLFGLADYKYEILAIMEHAAHLEKEFGCGPHTVSVPRIEPADNAPISDIIPYPVSDNDFRKIVSIIRIALPYTGIILSTRESESLRNELFRYGVSQISAGSRTNPGAYSENESEDNNVKNSGSQFSLGDHRSLEEIISKLIEMEYIPSFCTGCYRKGRVGNDFMDIAKPGLIQKFCMPNGLFTFYEYLLDFAGENTLKNGEKLIDKIINSQPDEKFKEKIRSNIAQIKRGERDIYF